MNYRDLPFEDSLIFSTDETPVGIWIDNEIMYRKVISLGSLPNTTTANVAHAIDDLNATGYVSLQGYANDGRSIPFSDGTEHISLKVDATNIIITTDFNASALDGYAIVEYTKS